MRTSSLFYAAVAVVAALGLASAIAAALGSVNWALTLGGVGVAGIALLFVLLDRRSQSVAQVTRSSADRARQAAVRLSADVRRVETLVDATQRRLVASLESARVEAADRHRETIVAK